MTIVQQIPAQDRIRGPNLALLIKRSNAVPMVDALRRADTARSVMASNTRLSRALLRDEWRADDVLPCWSGTMTAYDRPGKKLGATIEYLDSGTGITYVFPVPQAHRGKINVLLVAEHPDFELENDGRKRRIIRADKVGIVESFPAVSGCWHNSDPTYDLPTGDKVRPDNEAVRLLSRIDKRVGLVARGNWLREDRRGIYLNYEHSYLCAVAGEAAENSA